MVVVIVGGNRRETHRRSGFGGNQQIGEGRRLVWGWRMRDGAREKEVFKKECALGFFYITCLFFPFYFL